METILSLNAPSGVTSIASVITTSLAEAFGRLAPANKLTTINRTIAILLLFFDLYINDHPVISYSLIRYIAYLTYTDSGHFSLEAVWRG